MQEKNTKTKLKMSKLGEMNVANDYRVRGGYAKRARSGKHFKTQLYARCRNVNFLTNITDLPRHAMRVTHTASQIEHESARARTHGEYWCRMEGGGALYVNA